MIFPALYEKRGEKFQMITRSAFLIYFFFALTGVSLATEKGPQVNSIHTLMSEFKMSSYKVDTTRVRSLILSSSNINEKDDEDITALAWASGYGYTEIVKMLIDNGADVNVICYRNQTALTYALSNNLYENVELLVKAGAKINLDKKSPDTLLLTLISNNIKLAKLMISYGLNIENAENLIQMSKQEYKISISEKMVDYIRQELHNKANSADAECRAAD